jgi:cysteine desulfurase
VQGVGKIPCDIREIGADLLAISAHKLGGPKGVGALIRRDEGLHVANPLIKGGGQERGSRAGTENVAGIVGMGKAAEIALRDLPKYSAEVQTLRNRLEESLLQSCPDCRVNGQGQERLPNTSNISFKYLEGESILVLMDQNGICASTGSACTAGSSEPSHVLRAMEVPADWLQGAIRLSLSRLNTENEVRYVNEKMPAIVQRLQGLSSLGKLNNQQRTQADPPGVTSRIGARG